jgi:hypothetical protein
VGALLQDLVTPLWWRVGGGCRLNRDTGRAIEDSGLVVEERERFTYKPLPLSPRMPHILGRARKPASTDA